MTIVQLEYLLAVADYGSFSLASDHCFVTQPSLSTQIKNLEEELGVMLLNRDDKPLTLTSAGEVVVEQARKAIAAFNDVREEVLNLKNEVSGVLRLAVIPTIAPYILHLFIPQFAAKYPKLKLEIREMFTRDIEAALKKDQIDIGILAGGFVNPKNIDEEEVFKDKFFLYVSGDSPLCGREYASVDDIKLDRLILLADGHCLRSQVLDLCNVSALSHHKINFESGSLETIMRMVETTGGMTIIPEMATPFVNESHRRCLLSFRPEIGAVRDITMAVGKNFYKRSHYKALKNALTEMRKEQYYLI